MEKKDVLNALGIDENASNEEIKSILINTQSILENLISSTEDDSTVKSFQQQLNSLKSVEPILFPASAATPVETSPETPSQPVADIKDDMPMAEPVVSDIEATDNSPEISSTKEQADSTSEAEVESDEQASEFDLKMAAMDGLEDEITSTPEPEPTVDLAEEAVLSVNDESKINDLDDHELLESLSEPDTAGEGYETTPEETLEVDTSTNTNTQKHPDISNMTNTDEIPLQHTQQITPTPNKSKTGLIATGVVIVIISLFGAGYVTNTAGIADLINPATEESKFETAKVEKVRGEIEAYQKRLVNAKKELAANISMAKQNGSGELESLNFLKKITDKALYNSNVLAELQGDLRMGESLFTENSLSKANEILTKVRDKYKSIWNQYNAAGELYQSTLDVDTEKASWQKLKNKYNLDDPSQVNLANDSTSGFESAIKSGDFVKASNYLQTSLVNWKEASQAGEEKVKIIKKQRQQIALKKAAEKQKRLDKIKADNIVKQAAAQEALKQQAIIDEQKRLAALEEQNMQQAIKQKQFEDAEMLRKKQAALAEEKRLANNKLKPIVSVQPKYPRYASIKKISGWVDLEFTVDIYGNTKDIKIVNSNPLKIFDKVALDAMEKWKFMPLMSDGVAVERKRANYRMKFNFE